MLKDTKSLGNSKASACESRGFVHKKEGALFDTPPYLRRAESRTRTGDLFITNELLYQLSYFGFFKSAAKIVLLFECEKIWRSFFQ